MATGRGLSLVLAVSLLANALSAPADLRRKRDNNEIESREDSDSKPKSTTTYSPRASTLKFNDDDDDDDDFNDTTSAPSGGSDIFSLLRLAGALLPNLSSSNSNEDGQSDLGSLLAAVSGIVANLSGDGFDLNALIASGLGLFVGLLSEGEENPGAVIASYLLTSLESITGGGANNNGAFFGTFISKLVKGTSAGGDPDASSEEDENKMPMADSAGFFVSLLMSLLGEMSKTSSGGSWRRTDHSWINSRTN